MKGTKYKPRKVSTSEGKCVLVEVGALISWCIYSYRIVMLLVPYMWASMTFLPTAPFGNQPVNKLRGGEKARMIILASEASTASGASRAQTGKEEGAAENEEDCGIGDFPAFYFFLLKIQFGDLKIVKNDARISPTLSKRGDKSEIYLWSLSPPLEGYCAYCMWTFLL